MEVGEGSRGDDEDTLGTGDRLLECSETSGITMCGMDGNEVEASSWEEKEEEDSLSDEAEII